MNRNELIIKLIGLRISLGLQGDGLSKTEADRLAQSEIQSLYNNPEVALSTPEGSIATIVETYVNSLLPYMSSLGGVGSDAETKSRFKKANDNIINQIENHRKTLYPGDDTFPNDIDDYVYYRLSVELAAENNGTPKGRGLSKATVKKLTHSAKAAYMRGEVGGRNAATGSNKCFVATACFGSPNDETVLIFRRFRDTVLRKSVVGRGFIRWYYKHGKGFARIIETHPLLRKVARVLLGVIAKAIRLGSGLIANR